jgi:hypothetical protein
VSFNGARPGWFCAVKGAKLPSVPHPRLLAAASGRVRVPQGAARRASVSPSAAPWPASGSRCIRGTPHVEGNRLELEADAFIFDAGFPNAAYWKKLLRPGTPGRPPLLRPAAAKLSTGEIWEALKENRLKLPNTISIDSQRPRLPHPAPGQLHAQPEAPAVNFERVVSGTPAALPRQGAGPPRGLAADHPAALRHPHQLLDVPEGALRRAQPGRGQLRPPHQRRPARSDQDLRHEHHARDLQHRRPAGGESHGLGRRLPRAAVRPIPSSRPSRRSARACWPPPPACSSASTKTRPTTPARRGRDQDHVRGQSATMENRAVFVRANDDLRGFLEARPARSATAP